MVTRHTEGKEQPISTEQAGSKSKYTPENLIPMFRKAAKFRDEMVELEFTDNGGHSLRRTYLGHTWTEVEIPRSKSHQQSGSTSGRGIFASCIGNLEPGRQKIFEDRTCRPSTALTQHRSQKSHNGSVPPSIPTSLN